MTSAIMNPVAPMLTPSKIMEKRAEIEAAGIVVPEGFSDEDLVRLFNLGHLIPRAGSEMEAIRAANFLVNRDPSGAEWIRTNRSDTGAGQARRGGRRRG